MTTVAPQAFTVPRSDMRDPPAYRPNPSSLLSQVEVIDDPNLRPEINGAFPNICGACTTGELLTDPCLGGPTKTPTTAPDYSQSHGILLRAFWACSPVGFVDQAEELARLCLERGESFGLERALWDLVLNAGTPTPVAAANSVAALGLAERHLAANGGGMGLIHMDRGSATALAPHLTRTLSGLETIASGTPVIVGDGYDVEQPPPATTLTVNVWATGAIRVIRGPILELGRQVDRSVNDMSAIVERVYDVAIACPDPVWYSSDVICGC